MQKPAVTQVAINETIAARWSGRVYDADKQVTQTQIIALLEAARWAPSCFGDQPWRFIVWDKNANQTAWQQAFDCLAPSNQTWVKDAPVLFLICADTLFGHNGQANRWGVYDTGAAAENVCLQATSLGLMAHQMGGFDAKKARETFNVPEQYELMAMMSVGYAGALEALPDDIKERELAPRKRKDLGALFFNGVWNQPII